MLAFASASISCFEARHLSPARLSLGFTESQELGELVLLTVFPQDAPTPWSWPCPYHGMLLKSTHVLSVIADHYLKPPCSLWEKLILELWKRLKFCFAKDLESSKSGFCSYWNEMWHFEILGRGKVSKKLPFRLIKMVHSGLDLLDFIIYQKKTEIRHLKMKNQKGQNKSPLSKNSG